MLDRLHDLKTRGGLCLVALLMWLVFSVATLVAIALIPIRTVGYFVTGRESLREKVKIVGKALDQVMNAQFFNGNPKETVSSHAGRWLTEDPENAPRWAFQVDWITNKFEKNHVFKAIEEPFKGLPLDVT